MPFSIENAQMPLFSLQITLCGTIFTQPFQLVSHYQIDDRIMLTLKFVALRHIVHSLQVTMSPVEGGPKLLRALHVWRRLGDNILACIPEQDRKWIGVPRHVSNPELLTRRIMEAAIGSDAKTVAYLQRIPAHSTKEIRNFIRALTSRRDSA